MKSSIQHNEAALTHFLQQKAAIDQTLERLQAISDEHFNVHPDQINWGDAGFLDGIHERLTAVSDFVFQEGEYQT